MEQRLNFANEQEYKTYQKIQELYFKPLQEAEDARPKRASKAEQEKLTNTLLEM